MGEKSNISWTDDTWNLWRGCRAKSPGCKNCYARTLVERFGGDFSRRVRASDATRDAPLRWNKKPFTCDLCGACHSIEQAHWCDGINGVLAGDALRYHRRRVFSLSLGDWLDEDVPVAWLDEMLDVIERCPALDFLLLTKRPELWGPRLNVVSQATDSIRVNNLVIPWLNGAPPANVWVGVSVEDQARADDRIPLLLGIPAPVRFLSVEPLLGPIDLGYRGAGALAVDGGGNKTNDVQVDWVIVGGESGPGRREMKMQWLLSIVEQCRGPSVPCFVKQDGGPGPGNQGDIPDYPWSVKQFPSGSETAPGRRPLCTLPTPGQKATT
ncbi:MAG: hypothetical protein HW378_196 [Anaerolineales bacterium]|nr:hypothetical protein [Anaerolineales bacterium]